MKRLLLPVLALLCAAAVSTAAPPVQTWEAEPKIIYADTLGVIQDSTFTDSLYVSGARGIILMVRAANTSLGADTLDVPTLQMKLPNGAWTYVGGNANWPPSTPQITTLVTATTPITNQRYAIGYSNEGSTQGGTPLPIVNSYVRWRVGSNMQRRFQGAASTNLASSGTITYTAFVLR